ncbi:MAG TPA: cation:proton antiporter [Streptosporangiaceae bacterium]|nr:cation:proton antiporter [Streptosporangiaceae bacterium]
MDNLIADVIGDIALVLVLSSIFGAIARRCGQPAVVGQILSGIALGPSILGRLPGGLTARFFPVQVLPYLGVIAQVAVAIFMFGVGYELTVRSFRDNYRPAVLVAIGALFVPMLLGAGTVPALRSSYARLGQSNFSHSFILFMGVATSITALPVLAAIMRERGISGTVAGATATMAAGIMDVIAWTVFAAALVGTAAKAGRPWPVTLLLVSLFALVMLLAVRRVLGWWIRRPGSVLANQVPAALALTLASAWVTASLGLHPVFGGLLAGFAMPRKDGNPDPDVLRAMDSASSLLLPLFFVVTGLSVNLGALGGAAVLLILVLTAIACLGKIVPGYIGSRLGGHDRKDSATMGALVNTRGLTELIALNIGLDAGLISGRLFTVLVSMAVLTTLMTAPMLSLIRPRTALSSPGQPEPSEPRTVPGEGR